MLSRYFFSRFPEDLWYDHCVQVPVPETDLNLDLTWAGNTLAQVWVSSPEPGGESIVLGPPEYARAAAETILRVLGPAGTPESGRPS